jgi:hypothetical protein
VKITIEFIPHLEQRYNTCGDWRFDADGNMKICVSNMNTKNGPLLVAVHELVEALLCYHAGISTQEVDAFDINYKELEGEMGDDPAAPYHKQHCIATGIERILAPLMGVGWKEYEDELIDMTNQYAEVSGEKSE